MKVMVISLLIGAIGMFIKSLEKGLEELEIRGRIETIQTATLLRSFRILRKVQETRGDLLSLRFQ